MKPKVTADRSSKQLGGSEVSRSVQDTEMSLGEMMRDCINRESVEPPSIPLMIALFVATIWVGIYLANHWPLKPF
jgi:hypothetical protein